MCRITSQCSKYLKTGLNFATLMKCVPSVYEKEIGSKKLKMESWIQMTSKVFTLNSSKNLLQKKILAHSSKLKVLRSRSLKMISRVWILTMNWVSVICQKPKKIKVRPKLETSIIFTLMIQVITVSTVINNVALNHN